MNEKTVRMIVHDELRESQNIAQQLMDIKKELVTIHGEIGELRDMIRNKWWIPLIIRGCRGPSSRIDSRRP
jgi:hypothetical protein